MCIDTAPGSPGAFFLKILWKIKSDLSSLRNASNKILCMVLAFNKFEE
jgi:hypothetical protein